jgi:hypothetical protein
MRFREFTLPDPAALNERLYARYLELSGTDRVRQTHHIAGRFENTYIAAADIPGITTVLDIFRHQAGRWLNVEADRLKAGFWFNVMGPGHVTAPHHHDENDELLSAVYYIRVPEHSGELILYDENRPVVVQPQEGKLVMFGPDVLHEVTVNNSPELRLSVAMNVGPVDG